VNRESKNRDPEPGARKKYVVPSLVVYGAVGALTQSGSGMWTETDLGWSMGMWNGCSSQTSRKSCSERRVKENIVRIGDHPLGFGLYLFDYRPAFRAQWGHGRQFGVMIDEVETVMPAAVSMHPDGYRRVDYGMLGIGRHIN